jgi:hypothetical protein
MSNLVVVADFVAAQDWFRQRGLTDGLPVMPPTPDRVNAMVEGGRRSESELLGHIEGRDSEPLSVLQAAVCAVMAGADPAYFPVILATWDAIFDSGLNAASTIGSSGGTAVTAVVSGPYAAAIGMNSRQNVFGPGNHANATIGRAVRLGIMNGLGYRPGELDGAAFGNQARYTAHFAEAPPAEPWLPLNVRLGYPATTTTVTVAVTDAPRQVNNMTSRQAGQVLATLATGMKDLSHGGAGLGIPYIVVVGPEHEMVLREAGLTQGGICEYLARATRTTAAELAAAGVQMGDNGEPIGPAQMATPVSYEDADGMLPMVAPGHLILVTAGGNGSGWSHLIFGYMFARAAVPVTKEVRL